MLAWLARIPGVVWAAIIGALGTICTVILRRGQKELSIQMDGRLTQLLELTKKAAHAEGIIAEKADENARAALVAEGVKDERERKNG